MSTLSEMNSEALVAMRAGEFDKAIALFEAAIKEHPDSVDLLINLGITYRQKGNMSSAETYYLRALEMAPDHALLHNNLCCLYQNIGQPAKAIHHGKIAVDRGEVMPEFINNYLFSTNLTKVDGLDPQEEHKFYGRILEHGHRALPKAELKEMPGRIKVGLISGDFRRHPVSCYMAPFFQHYDRKALHVTMLSCMPEKMEDNYTDQFRSLADAFVNVHGISADKIAYAVRELGIHVLIDLSGHTAGNRLQTFAFKPSPVQCTWVGYAQTTGMKSIKHIILPHQAHFGMKRHWMSEEPAYLSVCAPYLPLKEQAIAPYAERFDFGCFQNPSRLSDETFAFWQKNFVFKPGCSVLLKNGAYKNLHTVPAIVERLRSIGAGRIDVEWDPSLESYYDAYNRIDRCLMATPYSGITSALDSYYMGVHVLQGNPPGIIGAQSMAIPTITGIKGNETSRDEIRSKLLKSKFCDYKGFSAEFTAMIRNMVEKEICR